MDTDQRLSAYLSGDLDADDAAALEAELAGDPELRTRLDRIRATDELLGGLPDVDLPDGFTTRLEGALSPELERVLGDELAARRARRQLPGWLPAAAAAALVVVVGGGIVLGGSGGEDADMAATDAGPETLVQDEDAAGGAGLADDGEAAADRAPGPQIVSQGRSVTPEDLSTLARELMLAEVVSGERVAEDPHGTAALYASSLGASRMEGQEAAGDAAGTEDAMSTVGAPPPVDHEGDVSPEDIEDVGRCVSVLSEDAADPVVPLYAELATDKDDTPVIIYAALSTDADGEYRRVEVWMVDRATCDLRQFAQEDR